MSVPNKLKRRDNMIKFEIAKGYEDKDINLPTRSTANAVGYDFEASEDIIIPMEISKPIMVKTGVKAMFPYNVALMLYNRSGNTKKGLVLANGVGVVDADYYGNETNDGNIMFAFYNFSDADVTIKKGDRIGQGVFTPFLLTDNDNAVGNRLGGFGSTGN
jgi:dUTP pyrophosphatase